MKFKWYYESNMIIKFAGKIGTVNISVHLWPRNSKTATKYRAPDKKKQQEKIEIKSVGNAQ